MFKKIEIYEEIINLVQPRQLLSLAPLQVAEVGRLVATVLGERAKGRKVAGVAGATEHKAAEQDIRQ